MQIQKYYVCQIRKIIENDSRGLNEYWKEDFCV